MLKNKKTLLYIFSFILIFVIFCYVIFNYISYKQKNKEYNNIVNNELLLYSDYNNSDYYIMYDNHFFLKEDIKDFYIDYSKDYSSNKSKIELLFSNNKLSFLMDSIYNGNSSIKKLIYIDYLDAFSYISGYEFTNNTKTKHYFLDKYGSIYNELYKFSLERSEFFIDKFFVLSFLEKNEILKNNELLKKIKIDLFNNYQKLSITDQLYFLFYLNELGDSYLDNFLIEKKYNLESIFDYDKLNINNKIIYLYLLFYNDIKIDYDIDYLKNNFDNMSYNSKLFFNSFLKIISDNNTDFYNQLENDYKNIDLNLKNKFIKTLLYKNKFDEYSSFDSYSKFWYACGYVVNRKKEYEIGFDKKTYYHVEYPVSRVEYDGQIDSRVASFEGDKFYLQIITKQK